MALFDSSISAINGIFHRDELVALGFADSIFNNQIQECVANSLEAGSGIEGVEFVRVHWGASFGGIFVDSLEE